MPLDDDDMFMGFEKKCMKLRWVSGYEDTIYLMIPLYESK